MGMRQRTRRSALIPPHALTAARWSGSAGEDGPEGLAQELGGLSGAGGPTPGDVAVRPHEKSAVFLDLAATVPLAVRVPGVPVDDHGPHRDLELVGDVGRVDP